MNPSVSSEIKNVHIKISHIENQLSSQIKIELIHDIQEVEKIWKYFNPEPQNIYQDWNYIKVFYDAYKYTPYFYTAYENNIPVACLPLEWVPERNRLEMFGNMSYIHYVFSKDTYEHYLSLLIQSVKLPLFSESIVCNKKEYRDYFEEIDRNYILDIQNISSGIEYLEKKFPWEGKSKFLQQMRKIESIGISIEVGKSEDLEWFFEMNKQNFWDTSAYHDKRRQENIRLLEKNTATQTYIRTFRFDGEIVAVYFFIKDSYNNTLYAINGASQKEIANLGKFVILDFIDLGLSLWCDYVDLWSTSFGYKQNWTTFTHPVYNFKKQ